MWNKFLYLTAIALVAQTVKAGMTAPDVVSFQPYRKVQAMDIPDYTAKLTNLNSNVNALYVLELQATFSSKSYAIEVPENKIFLLSLTPQGLVAKNVNTGHVINCNLSDIDTSVPYSAICGGEAFVRTTTSGYAGEKKELAANFLRNTLGSFGEKVIEDYKEAHEDANLVTGEEAKVDANGIALGRDPNKPVRADISEDAMSTSITAANMGIALKETSGTGPLAAGEWYSAKNQDHVFVSLIQSQDVAPEILSQNTNRASLLDDTEKTALDYMVAFDLNNFDLGWSHGTGFPGVAWSKRPNLKIDDSIAGPDGFGTLAPVQPTGILNPSLVPHLAATMCGGFQRLQGVFHAGDLGAKNWGSYYGFIEEGVVYSHLNPGLATMIIMNDGTVNMKTWTDADNALIPNIRFARQNGVPLVESDENGKAIPGKFVNSWPLGNWSGTPDRYFDAPQSDTIIVSQPAATYGGQVYPILVGGKIKVNGREIDASADTVLRNYPGKMYEGKAYPVVDGQIKVDPELRSARAGACISEQNGHRFLIYGYFSDVKPSSMARVFQAYGCQYAMHLDMNSPGQGYMGLMDFRADGQSFVETPVHEMAAMNSGATVNGKFMTVPRYVGKADNADFFYFLKKKAN